MLCPAWVACSRSPVASPPEPISRIPHEPGSYLLVFRTDQQVERAVGRLGTRRFRRGWHVYAGSARAGLRARLGHHLSATRPIHWHVDVLHASAHLVEVWVAGGGERAECALAAALAALPGAERCVGFGSSDCRCPGHLLSFARRPPLATLWPGLVRLPVEGRPPAPNPRGAWGDTPHTPRDIDKGVGDRGDTPDPPAGERP
jgi:Uri superfamily endonuclease